MCGSIIVDLLGYVSANITNIVVIPTEAVLIEEYIEKIGTSMLVDLYSLLELGLASDIHACVAVETVLPTASIL